MLTIIEYYRHGYASRTYANVEQSDLTVALYFDGETLGEKCTRKAAAQHVKPFRGIDLMHPVEIPTLEFAQEINWAGNGIYTCAKFGWTQEKVDELMRRFMDKCKFHKNVKFRSGGQSGFDEACIRVGMELGIQCTILAPRGFVWRGIDGKDTNEGFCERFTGEIVVKRI